MSDQREIELKLEVLPAKAMALRTRRLERLGGGMGAHERLASTYFDTPKHALRRNGLTLRVRAAGERRIQTIKEAGRNGAGLFQRPEWERDVEGDAPDLAATSGTPVHALLSEKPARGLVPIFTTEVDRTTWLIAKDGSEIEVALDEGSVTCDGQSQTLVELELELKRGHPADLFAMLHELGGPEAFRLGVMTKSEQGYRLASGQAPALFKAEPLALDRGMSAADAFAAIVRSCLRHFRLNEPLVVENRSSAALHQARVAMRRLRSALSLFRDLVEDQDYAGLRRRLKAVSDRLGEARNLDVYVERLTKARGPTEEDPELARLVMVLSVEREAAYARVIAALGSKRFRGLLLDLLAWSEAGTWRSDEARDGRPRPDRPIEAVAAKILRKRRRIVKRGGRHMDRLSPETRHEVRIAAKKLRYASEFFGGLVEGRGSRRQHKAFLGALEKLQGHLGDLNDIETGKHLATALPALAAEGLSPSLRRRVLGQDGEREGELIASAAKAHRELADAKPFWKSFARA